jgi:hypothetical protein
VENLRRTSVMDIERVTVGGALGPSAAGAPAAAQASARELRHKGIRTHEEVVAVLRACGVTIELDVDLGDPPSSLKGWTTAKRGGGG